MDYKGVIQSIPFGSVGVESDLSQTSEVPTSLMEAENLSLRFEQLEKEGGSVAWNPLAVLPSGVVGLYDFWPNDHTQRVIAVCSSGRVYKYLDPTSYVEITASGGAPNVLNPGPLPLILQCGSENAGSSRKLFILTGNDPVQVISADADVRTNMTLPALDWGVGNYPKAGVLYNARVVLWGNANRKHCLYESSVTDHEDFTTADATAQIDVYPGDGDRLETGFVYKSRLHVTKYPRGFYYIDDTTATSQVFKLGESFGTPTPLCATQVLDDMLIANTTGSITSLKAVFALGNVEEGDLIKAMKCSKYFRQETAQDGLGVRQAIYYEDKKQALFVYRSRSATMNNRIMVIDFASGTPKATLTTKDQPSCLALMRDTTGIPRPIYGDESGNIYQMDRKDRNVGGAGYIAVARTQYIDFGFVDKRLADQSKIFDFLEIAFVPSGRFPLYADIFVDSRYVETRVFYMNRRSYMSRTSSTSTFKLGRVRLRGKGTISIRKELHAEGRRISVRLYNTTAGQTFTVEQLTFYFRISGNAQRR